MPFWQIINHGVAEEVLLKMKAAMAAFFELTPEEKKKKYAQAGNDFQGYGQVYVVSEDPKLDCCDMVLLITLPPEIRNLEYWPDTIPGFKYVFFLCAFCAYTKTTKFPQEIAVNSVQKDKKIKNS